MASALVVLRELIDDARVYAPKEVVRVIHAVHDALQLDRREPHEH